MPSQKKTTRQHSNTQQPLVTEDSEEYFWNRVGVKYLLFFMFIVASILVIVLDFSYTPLLAKSPYLLFGLKFLLITFLFLIYVRTKKTVLENFFPKVNKEIIKTIYRIDPALTKDSDESFEKQQILNHKNFIANYIFLMIFVGSILLFFLIHPAFFSVSIFLLMEDSVVSIILKLILAGTVLGIFLSVRGLLSINKEYQHLDEVLWNIHHKCHGNIKPDNFHQVFPTNRFTLVGDKINAISLIVQVKGSITNSDILQYGFSHYRMMRLLLGYVTAAMPILGLIGTILGLMMAISGMERVMGQVLTNQDSFTQNLSASLEGISTAFYTTLAGSIAMLILRFFTIIFLSAHANFVSDLRNFVYTKIIPHLEQ